MAGVASSTAEWLTGWATLALAVIALVAGAIAALALRRENEQLRILQEDRRREQASLVAVWVEGSQPAEGGLQVTVKVWNRSPQPVYRCNFRVPSLPNAPDQHMEVLPLGRPRPENMPFFEPGIGRDVEVSGVEMEFNDAAVRRWKRQTDGTLVEVPDPSRHKRRFLGWQY